MSYLIKDTTKEERKKIVADSIALATLDAPAPSDEAMSLYGKYIEGEMELREVKEALLNS